MIKKLYILLLFLVCTLCATGQQRYFQIEVRQPAKIQLPSGRPDVQTVLVVNNAVAQPPTFGHMDKRNDENTGTSAVDLNDAARQCVFGAVEELELEGVYADVSVMDKSQNKVQNFYKRALLSGLRADSLMDFYGVDALLVLNQIVLYDVQESFETEDDTYYAYLQAYCSTHWSIHYKGKTNPLTFSKSDTLLWSGEDKVESRALAQLPNRETALIDFAYYAGGECAKMLHPQWVLEDRYVYYSQSDAMDRALDLFTRQHWKDAFDCWQQIAMDARESHMMRAYASADMAICAEMMGDYDAAARCAAQAITILEKMHTKDALQQRVNLTAYKERVQKRK